MMPLNSAQVRWLQLAKDLEQLADDAHGDSFRYALAPTFREAARALRRYYLPEDDPPAPAASQE